MNGGGGLVAKSCPTLVTPLSKTGHLVYVQGFFQEEYQSGLTFLSPGDLPDPGIEPVSPAWQADSLPLSHLGSPPWHHKRPRQYYKATVIKTLWFGTKTAIWINGTDQRAQK